MEHNARVAYRQGQRVEEIVHELCLFHGGWRADELGYGVIRAQDGLDDSERPVHAPRVRPRGRQRKSKVVFTEKA